MYVVNNYARTISRFNPAFKSFSPLIQNYSHLNGPSLLEQRKSLERFANLVVIVFMAVYRREQCHTEGDKAILCVYLTRDYRFYDISPYQLQ
jgi:hypothetical protein